MSVYRGGGLVMALVVEDVRKFEDLLNKDALSPFTTHATTFIYSKSFVGMYCKCQMDAHRICTTFSQASCAF